MQMQFALIEALEIDREKNKKTNKKGVCFFYVWFCL